ncbi:MAG: NAD(P)H-hydrate dehydratase [Chlamydiae bacterium]|nr:NAD(P)H-hydrate dehydratase [Chlamydiota bacterium]
MKVVTPSEMLRIEKLSIFEGASDKHYVEKVGKAIANIACGYIQKHFLSKKIYLLVGKGNNGADALSAGCVLLKERFCVQAYLFFKIDESSPLCRYNFEKFKKLGGEFHFISDIADLIFEKKSLILDGIFGIGFEGQLKGFLLQAVKKINQEEFIIAIDVPSGLNAATGEVLSEAIKADLTIFLGLPKMGFFLRDGAKYVGSLHLADFGLKEKYIKQAKEEFTFMQAKEAKKLLPKIEKNRHKYEAGYVVGIAGSKPMQGAAKLAGFAALKSGCGIVKILSFGYLDFLPFELINLSLEDESIVSVIELCNKADSVFIGPGLGRTKQTEKFLSIILPKIKVRTVLDADALYFLASNLKCPLPKDVILTPHRKEMLRLLGEEKIGDEEKFLQKCQKFADKYSLVIVLKGPNTFIFSSNKKKVVIKMGDPGMATAGTGDVLTGIIASLIAQGLNCFDASKLGVYLHGRSGEMAAEEKTSYSMIASDLISSLPKVFKSVLKA